MNLYIILLVCVLYVTYTLPTEGTQTACTGKKGLGIRLSISYPPLLVRLIEPFAIDREFLKNGKETVAIYYTPVVCQGHKFLLLILLC